MLSLVRIGRSWQSIRSSRSVKRASEYDKPIWPHHYGSKWRHFSWHTHASLSIASGDVAPGMTQVWVSARVRTSWSRYEQGMRIPAKAKTRGQTCHAHQSHILAVCWWP